MLAIVPTEQMVPPPRVRPLEGDPSTSLIAGVRLAASRQEDVPLTHRVKADPEPFEEVWMDRKTCEFRVNDRDYRVGDSLDLVEHRFEGGILIATGREVYVEITHIQRGYGIPDTHVAISFRKTGRTWNIRSESEVHARLRKADVEAHRRLNERLDRESKGLQEPVYSDGRYPFRLVAG